MTDHHRRPVYLVIFRDGYDDLTHTEAIDTVTLDKAEAERIQAGSPDTTVILETTLHGPDRDRDVAAIRRLVEWLEDTMDLDNSGDREAAEAFNHLFGHTFQIPNYPAVDIDTGYTVREQALLDLAQAKDNGYEIGELSFECDQCGSRLPYIDRGPQDGPLVDCVGLSPSSALDVVCQLCANNQ